MPKCPRSSGGMTSREIGWCLGRGWRRSCRTNLLRRCQIPTAAHRYNRPQKGVVVVRCQVRLVGKNALLRIQHIGTSPDFGDIIVVKGASYVVAAPPSEVTGREVVIWVRKVAGPARA